MEAGGAHGGGQVSVTTWDDLNISHNRFGHAIVKIGDRVVAVGGSKLHPDVMTNSVEEFEIDSGWRLLEDVKMKTPRANFGFTLVPHSMFPGCKILSKK